MSSATNYSHANVWRHGLGISNSTVDRSLALQLHSDSSEYSLLWVSVTELTRRMHLRDIVEAKPVPPDRWFDHDREHRKIAFRPALACLDTRKRPVHVAFSNGRHRTQWLISLGLRVVPLCVPHEEHGRWGRLKLVAQAPNHEDVLHLPARYDAGTA